MATILPQTSTRYYRSTRVVSNPTALGRRRFLRTEHSSRARSHVWVCCASSPDADIHIRPAELIDYWPAADLHCRAFSPEAEKHDEWEVRVSVVGSGGARDLREGAKQRPRRVSIRNTAVMSKSTLYICFMLDVPGVLPVYGSTGP